MARVPLVGFGVENFKSFADRQHIPIRPITLLFGKNSCGKSAMLRGLVHAQALAAGHRVSSPLMQDASHVRSNRPWADIGKYPDYLTKPDSPLGLRFELAPLQTRVTSGGFGAESRSARIELAIRLDDVPEEPYWDWDYGPPPEGPFLYTKVSSLLSDGEEVLTNGQWASTGPFWQARIAAMLALHRGSGPIPPDSESGLVRFIAEHSVLAEQNDFLPTPWRPLRIRSREYTRELGTEALKVLREWFGQDLNEAMLERMHDLGVDIINSACDEWDARSRQLLDALQQVDYLGPLRRIPESVFALDGSTGTGESWWKRLTDDSGARESVNRWLRDSLMKDESIQLKVEVEGVRPPAHLLAKITSDLMDSARAALAQRLADSNADPSVSHPYSDVLSPESVARSWSAAIGNAGLSGARARIRIQALGASRLLSPSEVGLGISQVVPVVAAALAQEGRLILVEQPELHLHPAMQAELGDLFIESALGSQQNTWIIETHSEHVLLRIMRRIRETSERRLPDGKPHIHPEDVSVCFVERDGESSRIYQVPLDERGMITRPWPGGFFEEGFREVFAW